MQRIFVTGATGTVGSHLVQALREREDTIPTAASRKPLPIATTATAVFDFSDPGTYAAADGHDAVFVLGPPLDPNLSELVGPFLDYLAAHGRPRVTYLSALGMEDLTELPFHAQMEERLRASSLPYTILRPSFFATNFGSYERENIEKRGIVFNPAGPGKAAFVDPGDIGRVAALTLAAEAHAGRTYELTGPRTHNMHEIAEMIGELSDKTVAYPEPSDEAYREALAAGGAPPFVADYMIAVYGLIRSGRVDKVTEDIPRLLGRPATDIRTVLKRDFG